MKFTDHSDDQTARLVLTQSLLEQRLRRGMTQHAVAEASGLTVSRVSLLECQPERISRFRVYTRYANAVGLSFTIAAAGETYAATPLRPVIVNRDDHHQYAVLQQVVETRHRTVNVRVVAERMGIGYPAVQNHEALDRDDPSVAVWQCYTRAVNGWLDLVLAPFDQEPVTA